MRHHIMIITQYAASYDDVSLCMSRTVVALATSTATFLIAA